jgi:hypothetical protein
MIEHVFPLLARLPFVTAFPVMILLVLKTFREEA